MPFDYVIHKERRLVISTGSGRVTSAEIETRMNQALSDPDFNRDFNELVDLRAATAIDASSDEARMLAGRKLYSPESKRAIVAASPAIFGMGRMWQAYTELSQETSQIRVFYDLPSALEWLGITDSSGLF